MKDNLNMGNSMDRESWRLNNTLLLVNSKLGRRMDSEKSHLKIKKNMKVLESHNNIYNHQDNLKITTFQEMENMFIRMVQLMKGNFINHKKKGMGGWRSYMEIK